MSAPRSRASHSAMDSSGARFQPRKTLRAGSAKFESSHGAAYALERGAPRPGCNGNAARYHVAPPAARGAVREEEIDPMKVGDWMNRRVVTCRAQDDLSKVARQMWDNDLGSLPVVDGNDRIVGVITDRDLCMGAYIKGRSLADLVASGSMQQEVHTCRPDDGVDHALAMMAERQIRRLPVVTADDRVVGIFTLGDAARASAGVKAARARRLLSEAVSLALAAI